VEENPVDRSERKVIEGNIEKARNHLQTAREHLSSRVRHSECIEASQECIELSVKSVLSFLQVKYERRHGWHGDEFSDIAAQIQKKRLPEKLVEQGLAHIRLPRLLFLANFWAQFYLAAKYGFEVANLAPAQELFELGEAELAVQHAEECHRAATTLRYLSQDKLFALATHGRVVKEDHPELHYCIYWNDRQGGIGPTPPEDAIAVEGDATVETVSYHIDSNAIAFWLEDGRFGTIQIHKDLRGRAPRSWPITSFAGRWYIMNLNMVKFKVVEAR
jgi:hypothetical protein